MNKRALIRVAVVPVHGCARMVLHDATAATRVLLLLEAEASIGMCVELRRVESGRVDANIKCGIGQRHFKRGKLFGSFFSCGVRA